MEKRNYFLKSVLTKPNSNELEEVVAGATEEEEEEVASGATNKEEEEVLFGAKKEEEEEILSRAKKEEEEDVSSGAKEEEEEEVLSREKKEEEVEARATEQAEAVAQITKQVKVVRDVKQNISDKIQQYNLFWKNRETRLKGQNFARQLYHQEEFSCPEIMRQLNEDRELAEATVKEYVTFFRFPSMSLTKALRSFLKVFWPEDEPEIQHLLITHFSCRFLMFTGRPLSLEPAVYYMSWAMIILNADLNGRHKGRKMTCEEFIANVHSASCRYRYPLKSLKNIYKSIKMKPLKAFRVKTRCQAADKKETSISEDSGCKSSFETVSNPTTTVHKTGNLICKRVTDENGRKTRKSQRAWKPFTAVLKGMVLHLEKDTSDLCEADNKNAIRLHHAVAYPVDYKNRPHVLCLKTADSRLFYFQAESEVEQTSWVAIINRIAARYSAPPLTSASNNIKAHHPQVLPSFPTTLSLEQQLEYHKDQLQRISEQMDYYLTLPLWDGTLSLDYMEQEVKRYTTYVRALQELVAEENAMEEEEVASGATEEEEVVSGATDVLEEEVLSGAKKEEEVEARAIEQAEAVAQIRKQVEVVRDFKQNISDQIQQNNYWKSKETRLNGKNFARQLCDQLEFMCPKIIRKLNEDRELAEITVKEYVKFFKFPSMSLDEALRLFLKVFWPEDELEIQHLLLTHFSRRFLKSTGRPLRFQPAVYYMSWAMIILNADLNGSHKGRKMTCEEFIANVHSASCQISSRYRYPLKSLKNVYKSIKMEPLQSFRVKTRCQAADKKETSIPKDSGCKSFFETVSNPTTTVHKTGNLICKRVTDENGRKTRKFQRAWKPFTAVLKGMVLHLQKGTSDLCEADNKNAIRLHHAVAYPVDYKNRPHVLCLKTADSRLFYFQAESEVEQTSWVAIINRIAARYSAPSLTSASNNIKAHHPQVLPSFPTTLPLEQQLEYHKDQLQRVSEQMDYYLTLPLWDGTLSLDYMEHLVKRYTTYVRALQELVAEEDPGEGCSNFASVSPTQICISISHKEDNNNLQKHS